MVKPGTRLLESVDVTVATIEQLKTPSPTVSDKDSEDIGQKIRYLIDQTEAILAKLDTALSTRASESTLSALNGKIPSDPAREAGNLASIKTNTDYLPTQSSFNHGQVTVGTSAVQLPNAIASKGVLVKAHKGNSGIVYVGNSNAVTTSTGFELAAGEAIDIEVDNANRIWLIADGPGQTVSWVAV
jgi:hypothetical protein